MSYRFWYILFWFRNLKLTRIFKFLLDFLIHPILVLFYVFQLLWICIISDFLLLLILALIHGGQIEYRVWLQFSCICWGLLYVLIFGLLWRKTHGMLSKTCISYWLGEMFCGSLLGLFDMMSLNSRVSLTFFQMACILMRVAYWNHPPSLRCGRSVFSSKSNSVSFIKLGAPMFGAYVFRIAISCWIFPLMSIQRPSLSHRTSFGLNSILSDVRVAKPICFSVSFAWNTLSHPCYSQVVSSVDHEVCFLEATKRWIQLSDPFC